jgi:hypothetical protein
MKKLDAWTQSVIDATDDEIDESPLDSRKFVAIVGSREFDDYEFLKEKVLSVIKTEEIACIVSGGARGADALAERFADEFGLRKDIRHADWRKHGRAAGHIRNADVVAACDVLVAFWKSRSPGTLDAIKKARCKHKRVHVFKYGEHQ